MTESDNKNEPSDADRDSHSAKNSGDANPLADAPVRDAADTIGGWMIGLLWVIALGAGTFMAQQWFDGRSQAREARVYDDERGSQALVLRSDRYGQYLVNGSANNETVTFLLDTGASGISIPQRTADKLGLRQGRPSRVMTANGDITVYATTLSSLTIGPFTRRDVKAHINPQMEGELALLGMSFLRHYELIQRDGELFISQP